MLVVQTDIGVLVRADNVKTTHPTNTHSYIGHKHDKILKMSLVITCMTDIYNRYYI